MIYHLYTTVCYVIYHSVEFLISTTCVIYTGICIIVIPWLRPWAFGYIYQQIPSSHGISDVYHVGHTHLIGERTNENEFHLFYTVASED